VNNQFSRKASLPHWAFAPLCSRKPELLQSLLMPFPALMAIIVLPDFGRTCSADLNNNNSGFNKMSVGLTGKRAGCMAGMTV
jgi:hypothetical protein